MPYLHSYYLFLIYVICLFVCYRHLIYYIVIALTILLAIPAFFTFQIIVWFFGLAFYVMLISVCEVLSVLSEAVDLLSLFVTSKYMLILTITLVSL